MDTKQMTEFRAIKDQCDGDDRQFRSINVASKVRRDAIVAAWDEIERLREALTEIASGLCCGTPGDKGIFGDPCCDVTVARAALEGGE